MESNENDSELLDMKAEAKLVPTQPPPAVIWRWCRKGVLARNGQRVYLEHRRYGRRLYTTRAALDAFAKATAEADKDHLAVPSVPTPTRTRNRDEARRRADVDAARARLQEGGLLNDDR